jgi:hypothetical protein
MVLGHLGMLKHHTPSSLFQSSNDLCLECSHAKLHIHMEQDI